VFLTVSVTVSLDDFYTYRVSPVFIFISEDGESQIVKVHRTV